MNVLILDDEEDMGLVLAHIIRRDGHAVTRVQTIEAACAQIEPGAIDVIISDMRMPKMNGIDFFKTHCRNWRGHFVLLTGDITVPVDEIYTIGIKHVLFKPRDLERIIPLLKELSLPQR